MINDFTGEFYFLSNFYPIIIEYEGFSYYSVEAAYQAAKTRNLLQRRPFTEMDARKAKQKGKQLKVREDWTEVKLGIMRELLQLKFQDKELQGSLVATFPHELVEGNVWYDFYWGICNEKGENQLGKLLMEVRDSNILHKEPA